MDDTATMAGRVGSLTARRRLVLEAMAEGLSNPAIEAKLEINNAGNLVSNVFRHLGIPPDISSRIKKRETAIKVFKFYLSTKTASSPGEGAMPAEASGASGEMRRPNGIDAPSPDSGSLPAEAGSLTPQGSTASGTGPSGYGVVNVMMLANPAQIIGVRTMTLDSSDEAQLAQHLSEGYVLELLADCLSLSDTRISVTRAVLVKRRR